MGDKKLLNNIAYIKQIYKKYLNDCYSVDKEWFDFFKQNQNLMKDVETDFEAEFEFEKIFSNDGLGKFNDEILTGKNDEIKPDIKQNIEEVEYRKASIDTAKAFLLIRNYRLFGHFVSDLDPLSIRKPLKLKELSPETYGFKLPQDLNKKIYLGLELGFEFATLNEIINRCIQLYCGKISFEYLHMSSVDEKKWMKEIIEGGKIDEYRKISNQEYKSVLEKLIDVTHFENIIAKNHVAVKRFGIEGGETIVVIMNKIIEQLCENEVKSISIGMAHRGRLNMLANVLGKEYEKIFNEFVFGTNSDNEFNVSGDVKYHLGVSDDITINDKKVHVSLCPNPSHLEAVNTVVLGSVRAKQERDNNEKIDKNKKCCGVLIHGDAAVIGQGVVAETYLLSQLSGYKTGGTIHIIHNNQIGFTTKPSDYRSSPYCSDMAKTIDAPVIHVNSESIEDSICAAIIAVKYRMKFKKDIVIDMWCYRRNGHNESDEPMFTQPMLYNKINAKQNMLNIYKTRLIEKNIIDENYFNEIENKKIEYLTNAYKKGAKKHIKSVSMFESVWKGLEKMPKKYKARVGSFGISREMYNILYEKLTFVPSGYHFNKKIIKRAQMQKKSFKSGKRIDWAMAEALAFGSLLVDGVNIRFSGEDSRRGTFSHRHSVWIDQKDESQYVPLANISKNQSKFTILDSPLSEFGVLGFEYGYSMSSPNTLVIWEAQFGDFANGAQIIIDQFISSGEAKWLRMNGLVLLLPHGYEGQGPEHSSARIERYLQMSANDNWQVCNVTTPANYFHLLRRQNLRNFRKPLILFTPKSLLRNSNCMSQFDDISLNTQFCRWYLDDETKLLPRNKIRKVVFCSGRIFYDMAHYRNVNKVDDVYIIRIEELYPFPDCGLSEVISGFDNAKFYWAQEEPVNFGPWSFVDRRIETTLKMAGYNQRANVYARAENPSPSVGNYNLHEEEKNKLMEEIFSE